MTEVSFPSSKKCAHIFHGYCNRRQKDALRLRANNEPSAYPTTDHELAQVSLQLAKWTAAQVGEDVKKGVRKNGCQ